MEVRKGDTKLRGCGVKHTYSNREPGQVSTGRLFPFCCRDTLVFGIIPSLRLVVEKESRN